MSYYPPAPPLPPGPWAPAAASHPRLKPTRGLAIAIAILVPLTVLLAVGQAFLARDAYRQIHDLAVFGGTLGKAGVVFSLTTSVMSLSFLTTAVLTMVWLSFLRINAMRISPRVKQARSTVWGTLGWLVPVVALWFPLQMVRDARHAFDTRFERRALPAEVGLLVGFWWFAFLVMEVFYWIRGTSYTRMVRGTAEVDAAVTSVHVFTVTALAAGALWLPVVITTEMKQARRIRQISQDELLGTPGVRPPAPGYPPAPPMPGSTPAAGQYPPPQYPPPPQAPRPPGQV